MYRFGFITLSLTIVITLFSCGGKPSNLIPEDKMVAVLTDMDIARAIYNNNYAYRTDSMRNILTKSVLDKHQITQADLDSSIIWYADEIKTYTKITDSVSAILKKRYESLNKEWARANAITFETDVLSKSIIRLDASEPNFSFNIDSINFNKVKKESFVWSFSLNGIASSENVVAGIFFTYKDSLVKQSLDIKENRLYKFSKPNLPDSLLLSISGYIHRRVDDKKISDNPIIIHSISYSDAIIEQTDTIKTTSKIPSPDNKPIERPLDNTMNRDREKEFKANTTQLESLNNGETKKIKELK